jgi:hypothetical protein
MKTILLVACVLFVSLNGYSQHLGIARILSLIEKDHATLVNEFSKMGFKNAYKDNYEGYTKYRYAHPDRSFGSIVVVEVAANEKQTPVELVYWVEMAGFYSLVHEINKSGFKKTWSSVDTTSTSGVWSHYTRGNKQITTCIWNQTSGDRKGKAHDPLYEIRFALFEPDSFKIPIEKLSIAFSGYNLFEADIFSRGYSLDSIINTDYDVINYYSFRNKQKVERQIVSRTIKKDEGEEGNNGQSVTYIFSDEVEFKKINELIIKRKFKLLKRSDGNGTIQLRYLNSNNQAYDIRIYNNGKKIQYQITAIR